MTITLWGLRLPLQMFPLIMPDLTGLKIGHVAPIRIEKGTGNAAMRSALIGAGSIAGIKG